MSSGTVYKMRGAQTARLFAILIISLVDTIFFFQRKRTYLLNEGQKTSFRKTVILAKLLLCEMSSTDGR